MEVPPLHDDLQINQNLKYQHRSWIIERVFYVLLTLTMIAMVLGVFGRGGILDNATISRENINVKYSRFLHRTYNSELKINLGAGDSVIHINREYLSYFDLKHIIPQPATVTAEGKDYVYVFNTKNVIPPLLVRFIINPVEWGKVSCNVKAGKSEISIHQFIYP